MTTAPLGTDAFSALSRQLADAAERVAPAIVQVFGRKRPASGIVIGPERVVSTSHSVEWQEGVRVRTNDGKSLPAEVVGHAPGADLVLLKVPGLSGSAFPGTELPRPGQLGLLTGRSWSGIQQVRLAVVSGVGGPLDTADGTRLDRVISLPASPYPGYSGSALVDPGRRPAGDCHCWSHPRAGVGRALDGRFAPARHPRSTWIHTSRLSGSHQSAGAALQRTAGRRARVGVDRAGCCRRQSSREGWSSRGRHPDPSGRCASGASAAAAGVAWTVTGRTATRAYPGARQGPARCHRHCWRETRPLVAP